MNWRVALIAVLAVLAVVIGWSLLRQGTNGPAPLEAGRSDYTLYDFELVSLDAQGAESFTLRAPKLTRDPNVRTMDIVTPLFVIPPRAGSAAAPWEVRSKTGWVSQKGDEVRLRGDVVAVSSTDTGAPMRIDSQQLDVFPQANRATSRLPVSVKRPGLILTGHDMDARLDTRLVYLKDIKARYESNR